MLLTGPTTPTAATPATPDAKPIQALRAGELGSRLLRMATLAAAIHMAESTHPRTDDAQDLPEARS